MPIYASFLSSRALKDQGYQSDSTLVFKKRNDVEHLSPVDQKMVYKAVQHGGEVPLHGFRKPLPEKPKGECENSKTVFTKQLYRKSIHPQNTPLHPATKHINTDIFDRKIFLMESQIFWRWKIRNKTLQT
jgi:hypothetical protein